MCVEDRRVQERDGDSARVYSQGTWDQNENGTEG